MINMVGERNSRKTFIGVVTSVKMNKTITVQIERKTLHPLYRKLVIKHTKYHAHDEKNEAKVGDKVMIVETKPISKTKFYRLNKFIERAK
ncbi:30S ribosomal protein S17 [Bacilli bacterium]|nr:30S ribosomal protein S17 [Bacilli bacterium]